MATGAAGFGVVVSPPVLVCEPPPLDVEVVGGVGAGAGVEAAGGVRRARRRRRRGRRLRRGRRRLVRRDLDLRDAALARGRAGRRRRGRRRGRRGRGRRRRGGRRRLGDLRGGALLRRHGLVLAQRRVRGADGAGDEQGGEAEDHHRRARARARRRCGPAAVPHARHQSWPGSIVRAAGLAGTRAGIDRRLFRRAARRAAPAGRRGRSRAVPRAASSAFRVDTNPLTQVGVAVTCARPPPAATCR